MSRHYSLASIVGLLLFVLLTHVLLLLNPSSFWDGWIVSSLLDNDDLATLGLWYYEMGAPYAYWLQYLLNLFPDYLLAYRLFVIVCMLVIALTCFYICISLFELSKFLSWFVAGYTATWPFYNVYISEIFPVSPISIAMFFSGWAVNLYADKNKSRYLTAISYGLFGASYFINEALMALHYGFVLAYLLKAASRSARLDQFFSSTLVGLVSQLRIHWFMLIFPFVILAGKMTLIDAPSGDFEGYNSFYGVLSAPAQWIYLTFHHSLATILYMLSIPALFVSAASELWQIMIMLAALYVISIVTIYKRGGYKYKLHNHDNGASYGFLVLAALAFTLLGSIPTAALGKYIYSGWGERYAVFMAFGIGLLIASACTLLHRMKLRQLPYLTYTICFCALMFNFVIIVHKYIQWQARSVIESAIVHQLAEMTPPADGTLIILDDRTRINIDSYRSYELAGIIKKAWGEERWYVTIPSGENLRVGEYIKEYHDQAYSPLRKKVEMISDFEPNGSAVVLTVRLSDVSLSHTEIVADFIRTLLHSESYRREHLGQLIGVSFNGLEAIGIDT